VDAAAADTGTIVVPYPARLGAADLTRLVSFGGDIVLIAPAQDVLDTLGTGLTAGPDIPVRSRPPGCGLAAAVTAGSAGLGGLTYSAVGGGSTSCYDGSLAILTGNGHRVIVLGTGSPLTNQELDRDGNAALALGLLDRGPSVAWVLPTGAEVQPASGGSTLTDHLPHGLRWGILQLVIAVVLLALARGRRLGPPVPEQLPVTVRAAETVEGRARLYRAARARQTAAEALREGTRQRLTSRLLPGPGATPPEELVRAVATRTGRDPGEVASLLYGPDDGTTQRPPLDDNGLLQLADDLETLDRQVRRT
jgi:hypothetical protein